jgi:hypothetical protein
VDGKKQRSVRQNKEHRNKTPVNSSKCTGIKHAPEIGVMLANSCNFDFSLEIFPSFTSYSRVSSFNSTCSKIKSGDIDYLSLIHRGRFASILSPSPREA